MTNEKSLGGIQRRRRERRAIPPYGDGSSPNAISNVLDRLLARSQFAPFKNVGLGDQDTYFLSHDEVHHSIKPRFEIVVHDISELTTLLGVHEEDLELGLSVRIPRLRRYTVLNHWKLDDVPPDPWSPDQAKLEGLQCGRGMDFVLAMRVVTDRSDLAHHGLGKGKVLCRKIFSVKEKMDSLSFPFQWAEFGGDTGYPDEALWVIEWKDSDNEDRFNRPVHEVLTVVVNKKAEGPLNAMGDAQGASDLAWRMLAADITTQIYADVLSKIEYEPDETDTETLEGQVFARLSRVGNIPYTEIKGLVERDDSLTELRNIVAMTLNLVV